jgi:AraC-like DNA-binding protein
MYKEYVPGGILKHYVQCYFTCETDTAVITNDKVFAAGFIEIMFNIGAEGPQKITNGGHVHQPPIQLWGQTVQPFTFTSSGKHTMFGIRFFPHTAAFFFGEAMEEFNDKMLDLTDIAGTTATLLHARLMEAKVLYSKIELVEDFLLARLSAFGSGSTKLQLMHSIMQDLSKNDFWANINTVAARYGMSSRYLQKLFLKHSGLSPGLFSKIARFQKSLQLVSQNNHPLTAIAHSCGYYDQSHFIKDFKYFTGTKPSVFLPENSTDLFVPLNN